MGIGAFHWLQLPNRSCLEYTTPFGTVSPFEFRISCFEFPRLPSQSRAIPPSPPPLLSTRREALLWGCALLLPGCQGLLRNNDQKSEIDVAAQLLKPIPQMKDGIRLDVFRVDRHVGDPRIGDSMWKAVSQGGSLDPATIRHLNEHGFRFGTVPTNPPVVLQSLILATNSGSAERTLHESFAFPTGGQAILDVMPLPEGLDIVIPGPEGSRPMTLHAAKAVLNVRADRIEDGWARLEVVPEIHHGEILNRPVAGEREWIMRNSQAVEPLYQFKFHVELNRGEMVVVGLHDLAKSPVGRWFFRNQLEGSLERVMMIRMADVFAVQGKSVG